MRKLFDRFLGCVMTVSAAEVLHRGMGVEECLGI